MEIEIRREDDDRWTAVVPDLPGVMTTGKTWNDAVAMAKALALRVLADRVEHGEPPPELGEFFVIAAHVDRARRRELIERMRGRATGGMTTDEILHLTRGDPE